MATAVALPSPLLAPVTSPIWPARARASDCAIGSPVALPLSRATVHPKTLQERPARTDVALTLDCARYNGLDNRRGAVGVGDAAERPDYGPTLGHLIWEMPAKRRASRFTRDRSRPSPDSRVVSH